MCRLLGVVARGSATIDGLLPGELPRFEALSGEHGDGWGIGWVDGDRNVTVRKEPVGASSDPAFVHAATTIETDAAMLHLRQASPGMPLTTANTHPFLADGWCFAHNGYAWPAAILDSLVVDAGASAPDGDTDSERYFSLVRAALREGPAPDALSGAARSIGARVSITSLNCLLLGPDVLYAVAWWDGPGIRSQPDGETERDYRLWYRADADRVVVASAGIQGSEPGWQELPNRCVLEVTRGTLAKRVLGPTSMTFRGLGIC
jgi:predicted glutamine amidotransferase